MDSDRKNIVVIGAGYGGITAALRASNLLRSSPVYRVVLVDRYPFHTLKTQLHEAAVHKSEVTIDIGCIIRKRGISFQLGVVKALDLVHRTVQVGDVRIPYEYLGLALGSQANFYNIPGLEENAFPLQSASDAQKIYEHISEWVQGFASGAMRGNPSDLENHAIFQYP